MRSQFREEPCKTALNRVHGMFFKWSLNPYMGCAHRCTFCYVRAFEKRADRPFDDRYGASLRVKTNVARVLHEEVRRRTWKRELIAIGAATDPYQPAEGMYRLTRACLEVLCGVHNPFSLITRGPMIVRDVDVISECSRRAPVSISFSIPTLDADVWRKTEPGTAPPRQRLRAIERLAAAGINVGVSMAPILPGLSDGADQLREVVRAARDAGARSIWAGTLRLSPGTREHFLAHLARDWPQQLPLYERLYRTPNLPRHVAEPVLQRIAALRHQFGLDERQRDPAPASQFQLPLLEAGALQAAQALLA